MSWLFRAHISKELELSGVAAPEAWAVLTDFESYPEWSSWFTFDDPPGEVGSRFGLVVVLPGSAPLRFVPEVVAREAPRHLAWTGKLWGSDLFFTGVHSIRFLPDAGGACVRLLHEERMRGLLVPLMRLMGTLAQVEVEYARWNQLFHDRVRSKSGNAQQQ